MLRPLLLSLLAAASVHAQEAARDLKVRFLAESALPDLGQVVLASGAERSRAPEDAGELSRCSRALVRRNGAPSRPQLRSQLCWRD